MGTSEAALMGTGEAALMGTGDGELIRWFRALPWKGACQVASREMELRHRPRYVICDLLWKGVAGGRCRRSISIVASRQASFLFISRMWSSVG